jgi:hypothetical protein
MADENSDHRAIVLESPPAGEAGNAASPQAAANRLPGIVLGRLTALVAADSALVTLKGHHAAAPSPARCLTGLSAEDVGREVALMFEGGDPARPLILGRVEEAPGANASRRSKRPVSIDAEAIVLNGEREIVLRCGDATLTLTRDGKLFLKGAYVETLATGVNRIKGGSVKIN